MVRAAAFYAVRVGRAPGIYGTWAECEPQVKDFPEPRYKIFSTLDEAEKFMSRSNSAPSPARARVSLTNVVNNNIGAGLVVYTDGACKNNQGGGASKLAGLGVYFGDDDERNIAERVPGNQTNNRAELLALIRALEVLPHEEPAILLKTDSEYSINCVTKWIDGWRNRGWRRADGKPIANLSLVRYLHTLIEVRRAAGFKVELEYVKGHAGVSGNEAADQLANEGCTRPIVENEPDWDALAAALERDLTARTIESSYTIAPLPESYGGTGSRLNVASSSPGHARHVNRAISIDQRASSTATTPRQTTDLVIPDSTDSDDELWAAVTSYSVRSESSSFTLPFIEAAGEVIPETHTGINAGSQSAVPAKPQYNISSPIVLATREGVHSHPDASTSFPTFLPSTPSPRSSRHEDRSTQRHSYGNPAILRPSAPPANSRMHAPAPEREPVDVVMDKADDTEAPATSPADHNLWHSSITPAASSLSPEAIEAQAQAYVTVAKEEAAQLRSLIAHVKTLQRAGRLKDQELLTCGTVLRAKELELVAKDAELRAKDAELISLKHQVNNTRSY